MVILYIYTLDKNYFLQRRYLKTTIMIYDDYTNISTLSVGIIFFQNTNSMTSSEIYTFSRNYILPKGKIYYAREISTLSVEIIFFQSSSDDATKGISTLSVEIIFFQSNLNGQLTLLSTLSVEIIFFQSWREAFETHNLHFQ